MSGGVASDNAESDANKTSGGKKFADLGKFNPKGFFAGRKPLWWAWWLVRLGALVAVLVGFIILIVNFYKYPSSNCSWCYRFSCLVSYLVFLLAWILLTSDAACQRLVRPRKPVLQLSCLQLSLRPFLLFDRTHLL